MREIKFRYVFKREATDLYKSAIQIRIFDLEHLEIGSYKHHLNQLADEGYEIIARDQFAGLKDKNVVEVWEGDIFHVGYNHIGNVACEMVNGQWNIAIYDRRKTRVVGNIWQNSELLKV